MNKIWHILMKKMVPTKMCFSIFFIIICLIVFFKFFLPKY